MSGTKPMTGSGIKDLDSKEICSIIQQCAAHGVTSMKLGDFQIEFSPKAKQEAQPLKSETHSKTPEAAISEKQHEKNTKEALEAEEEELRATQIAEMLIEDPEAAEQLIIDGELKDADRDESDDGDDE